MIRSRILSSENEESGGPGWCGTASKVAPGFRNSATRFGKKSAPDNLDFSKNLDRFLDQELGPDGSRSVQQLKLEWQIQCKLMKCKLSVIPARRNECNILHLK